VTQALVAILPNDDPLPSLQLATDLRAAGIRTDVTLDAKRNLPQQFTYAERKGIPYVLIAGSDERDAATVTLRTLATRAQQQVPRTDLAATLHRLLNE
ncbi:MAG: histidine--tRNA ligase, partial [Thermomicrobia bacterium]|nr:histidine--tRNA ligase [Thermomicrobia bacterium]MCA1724672.1 histidine--tRNA ligase [Thermomicrobia bacterium]